MKKGLLALLMASAVFSGAKVAAQGKAISSRTYYIDNRGDDNGPGDRRHPYRSLQRLNRLDLVAGDTVSLCGGQVFEGKLQLRSGIGGTRARPIVILSYGQGKAVINSGNAEGIVLYRNSYVTIRNLRLTGAGRKEGNTKDGLAINECRHILVDSCVVSGYQKAGVFVYRSSDIRISRVRAHDNGYAGISLEGAYGKRDCSRIVVTGCLADNNPGDPTNLVNHSGNGIIAGYCRDVRIDQCTATGNGWDMPRIGNGPVGIWAYESDSVVIGHCISYRNRTARGADDGGGFDLDGGITHSVIEYCLSYENEGSGFGLFQYAGASAWHDNSVHDCVSTNDGLVSAAHAGVFIWNSSRDPGQLRDCQFYNNVVYNTKGAVINYAREGKHSGFRFYHNAFVAADSLIKGVRDPGDVFTDNHWTGVLPDNSFH